MLRSVQDDLQILQLFWKITKNVLILKILLARLVKSQQLYVIARGKKITKPYYDFFSLSQEIVSYVGPIFVLLLNGKKQSK